MLLLLLLLDAVLSDRGSDRRLVVDIWHLANRSS